MIYPALAIFNVIFLSVVATDETKRNPVDVLKIEDLYIQNYNGPFNSDTLELFGNIEYLTLRENKFSSFNFDFLHSLPQLKNLLIDNNTMNKIDYNLEECCNKLEKIHIQRSGIPELQKYILKKLGHLKSLKTLVLRSENITSLSKDTLVNPNLEYLAIGSSRLESIEDGAFEKLKNLKYLDLTLNSLRHLKKEMFENLENLQVLKLKGNFLEKVTTEMFPSLPNLEIVTLSYNLIDHLDLGGIKNVAPKLKTVEVAGLNLDHSVTGGVNFVQFAVIRNGKL